MIYTAPYVMLFMRANPLQGQVGGGRALEIETFLGPVWNDIEPSGELHLGPKKVKISRAQPPPTCPINGFARIKSIMYRTVLKRGVRLSGG